MIERIYNFLKNQKDITNVEKYVDSENQNHIAYTENEHQYIITIDDNQFL